MEMTAEERDALSRVTQTLRERFDAREVILYGSAARGQLDEESDIDLLVVLPRLDWELQKEGSSGFCVLSVERPRRPGTCPRTSGILRFSPAAWLQSTCHGYRQRGTTRAFLMLLAQSDKCRGFGGSAPKRDASGLVHLSEPDPKPPRQRRKSTQKPDEPH